MKDICPELIKNINDEFEKNCIKDANMRALVKKIEAGTATYTDAYKYAEAVGAARANAFQSEISSEVLPDGKMYYNIAERVMTDSLGTDHEMIADFAEQVQKAINDNAGIRLKAQRADLDEDRIDGFVQRLASEDNVDNAKWLLNEPVKTHARSVVDDTVKKNAKFQHKAGIKAKVVRYGGSDCCKWCDGLTGEYIYPSVPREVFMRHDNCRCSLDYNGKKLTAYESGGVAHTFRDQGGINDRKAYAEEQERLQGIKKIENQQFYAFKSLSAMAKKFYVDEDKLLKKSDWYIKQGTYVTGVKVLCSGNEIREVNRLIKENPLPNGDLTKAKDWYKVRGRAHVTNGENSDVREIHWYQAQNIGKIEFKFPTNEKQL